MGFVVLADWPRRCEYRRFFFEALGLQLALWRKHAPGHNSPDDTQNYMRSRQAIMTVRFTLVALLVSISASGIVGQELKAPEWWRPGDPQVDEATVFVTVQPCLTGACRTGHQMDNIVSAFIACAMMDRKVLLGRLLLS